MAQDLQANTEVKVRIGEFVAVGDGFTPETGITLGAADEAEALKHNGVATVDISGNTWAAVTSCDGWYDLTLTTTDTNTEGNLTVVVQDDSVCLPVHVHFNVLAQAAWISKYTAKDTGYMDVDVKAISTDTTAADNAELAFDGTGFAFTNCTMPTTTAVTNEVTADAVKISGDGTAADDLELLVENCKGTDHKVLLSTDAQDLSASLDVNTKLIEAGDATDAINAAVDAALDTAIPGTPTAHSVNERIKSMDVLTEASGSGDLAAILTDTGTTLENRCIAIEADTADIQTQVGTAGAGLTDLGGMSTGMKAEVESEVDDALGGGTGTSLSAIPWNSSWDTEVQSEVDDALVALNLDHLCKTVTASADMTTEVVDNTILSRVLASGDTSAFDPTTDSLQDIRDKQTDIITEVDANETKIDTVDTVVDGIQTDLSNATDGLGALKALIDTVDGVADAILADTVEIQGSGFSTATDSLVKIHDDHAHYITAAYGSAQKALIDALPSGIAKNAELANLTFPMILSSDHETYATGKTLTEEISKDGGNYAACTNSASEIQSSGTYKITLTATEMNANVVTVRFTETDCDATTITIITT